MTEEINHEFYGKIKIFSNDQGICKHLKDGKTIWEEDLQKLFSKYYKDGNILDIGAFIGLHTIAFSKICKGYVWAFESQPQTFELLSENVKSCRFVNVYNVAISNTTYIRHVIPFDTNKSDNFAGIGTHTNPTDDTQTIRSFRLDDLTFAPIGLIKIDVEGHEYEVLKGAENTIKKHKPVIFVEILGGSTDNLKQEEKDSIQRTQNYIISLGYRLEQKVTVHDYIYVPI